jgi:hypothetical protein
MKADGPLGALESLMAGRPPARWPPRAAETGPPGPSPAVAASATDEPAAALARPESHGASLAAWASVPGQAGQPGGSEDADRFGRLVARIYSDLGRLGALPTNAGAADPPPHGHVDVEI